MFDKDDNSMKITVELRVTCACFIKRINSGIIVCLLRNDRFFVGVGAANKTIGHKVGS